MIKLKKVITESIIEFTPEEREFIELLKMGDVEIENASEGLMEKFYNFFNETMPYGTMKARTGDPLDWIMQHIDEIPMEQTSNEETISEEADTRYTVTFSMYMFDADDNAIKRQADEFIRELDDKYDNQPRVLEIHETPFATLSSRKLD